MRCRYDTGLFSAGDALDGAAVFIGFTKPDFDDNQRQFVGHYQIELALFAAEIPAHRLESFVDQVAVSLFLGAFAAK